MFPHRHSTNLPLRPCSTLQNLLNEPRCKGCPPGTVAKWMDEQARYVKSVSGMRGLCCDSTALQRGKLEVESALAVHGAQS